MRTKAIDFNNFRNSEPERNVNNLPVGKHRVRVVRAVPCTDRNASLTEPTLKDKEYPWNDETPQLAIIFQNKEGSMIQRYNGAGYVRFEEIPEDKQEKYVSAGNGYAVDIKTKRRIVSKERTAAAMNILNNLFHACKRLNEVNGEWEPIGTDNGTNDLIGCELEIEIGADSYNGKAQLNVVATRRFAIGETVENEDF